jgi:HK97 family phage portal protein
MEIFGTNIFGGHKRESLTPQQQAGAGIPASTDPNHPTNKQDVKGGSFEERIVSARHPRVALTVSAVYRAVELRAKTIGQMQMQYQVRDREGGNFVMDVQKPRGGNVSFGTRLNYLLQVEPNPMMSAQSLWEQVTVNRLMLGNGFVYIERDELGEPKYLWLAECGGYNLGTNTYVITYMGDKGIVKNKIAPREDVLHFPNTYRERNGFWGLSTLRFAFDTLSLIKTEGRLALETAAKGGRVKGFIGEDTSKTVSPIAAGLFDKSEMEAYAKEVNEKVYQQDINVLRGLDKFQNLSLSAQDMQMIEMLGMSHDDVARFYATPRPLLMMDTNSHYTTYTNATMEYLSRTIAPDGAEMEAECFRKFLSIYDYGQHRFHLCEQPLLRMDKETQAKVDMLNLQTGAKTINEVRAEHDMPAVENGDEPMASANLMTLKALLAKADASTQLKPGNYTVGEPPKEGDETA